MSGQKIGFFDSGVGGLSVLKQSLNILPKVHYIYLGDTARMPYGIRDPYEVEQFTVEGIEYISSDLKALMIACNTATAYGLKKAQQIFTFPVIGVVKPACVYVDSISDNKNIALLATEGTVNSGIYKKTLKLINPELNLREISAPDLVLAIENGHIEDDIVKKIIEEILEKIDDFNYDTLILGCTHFPLAMKTFEKIFEEKNRNVNIIDPAIYAVEVLDDIINPHEDMENIKIEFYTTGDIEKFKDTTLKVLDLRNIEVEFKKVDLIK